MTITFDAPTTFAPELNISGLTLRNWRDDADFDAMHRIFSADKSSDGVEDASSPQDLRARLESLPNMEIPGGVFLVEHDGKAIAYQTMRGFRETSGGGIYIHHLYILPEWKGRGIERAMIHHGEAQLRRIARNHPAAEPKVFQAFLDEKQIGLAALLEQANYHPERYFYEMVRPNLDNIPDVALPAGVQERPPRREDYRKIWDTAVEAFKEHWGEEEHTDEDYERWLKGPHFQPDLWHIVWDGNRPVAIAWNMIDKADNEKYHRKRGITDDLATLKEYRGRGIAQALLARSFQHFKELGLTQAMLGVDSENKSGALRLYEKMGYRREKTVVVYRKPLTLDNT